MDSDTRELLEVVANVRIPEICKIVEEGKERYNMCKAFEDYKLEGIQEVIERIVEVQRKIGSYDVAKICEALRESTVDPMCLGKGM